MTENIFPDIGKISKDDRGRLTGINPKVFWLFGLSGSGKSALARRVEERLTTGGVLCCRLDGDNLRSGLNSDLGFSREDRFENIRRAAEAAKLIADSGVIVLSTFITPKAENRKTAEDILGDLYEGVYIKCSVDTCIGRDPKGLYKKAAAGEIKEFTGISSPFEEPEKDVMIIDTSSLEEAMCADILFEYIMEKTSL